MTIPVDGPRPTLEAKLAFWEAELAALAERVAACEAANKLCREQNMPHLARMGEERARADRRRYMEALRFLTNLRKK